MEPKSSLLYSQAPTTCPYPEPGTTNTNAYFQNTSLPGCFAAEIQFCSCYFYNLMWLDNTEESAFIFKQLNIILVYTLCFLYISAQL